MGRPATLKVEILADAKGVSKGAAEAEGRFSRLGSIAGKAGKAAALGVGAIGVAAGAMAVASVKAASDLEQAMGGVETVFGKAADQVKGYADKAAETVGLSKSQYATMATSVGNSLKTMGRSMGDTATATDAMVSRAADMSATFGGTTEEAVQAVGSALRGEMDPLERFGVNLKASDISARLAAQGQSKLTGEQLKAAQMTAAYDLIMEKSKQSTGAFSRESDTLAHQQQVLTAKFDNVKAALGARLIPLLVKAAEWFQTKVLPAAQRLGEQLGQRLAPVMAQVGAWVTTKLLPALRSMTTYVMQNIVPAYQRYLVPIIQGAIKAFQSVAGAVGRNSDQFAKLKPVIQLVVNILKWAAPIVGNVFGKAFQIAGGFIGGVIDVIGGLIGFIDSVIRKFDDLWRKVNEVGSFISDKVGAISNVVGKIPGFSLEVTRAQPTLVGPVGGMGLGPAIGLLTASAGELTPLAYSLGAGAGRSTLRGGTGTTVNMPITITGALDPVAVARQLEGVLRDAAVRLGRRPAYG